MDNVADVIGPATLPAGHSHQDGLEHSETGSLKCRRSAHTQEFISIATRVVGGVFSYYYKQKLLT